MRTARTLLVVCGSLSAGEIEFGSYAKAWQRMQVHRATTTEWIDTHFGVHVLPVLENRTLPSIHSSDIQSLVKHQSETLSPATVETGFRILSAIFKAAAQDRRIPFNPCTGTKLPDKTRTRVDPPRTGDVLTIVEAFTGRYRAAPILAAGCGLRQGDPRSNP